MKLYRYHTEKAEDYWNREYLDYSDKPMPMGDIKEQCEEFKKFMKSLNPTAQGIIDYYEIRYETT